MSIWQDFLEQLGTSHKPDPSTLPGEVMICFVNRYLEALDGVRYKFQFDNHTYEGKTTEAQYCVKLTPQTLDPIRVFVWARKNNAYKELDSVVPKVGSKLLVRKAIKTYKTKGKTEPHPKNQPIVKPPVKPAPAPAPGPSPTTDQGVKPVPQKDESGLPQTDVKRPVPDKITKEQLKKIFPAAKLDYLQQIADELNKDLVKFKLDTPLRRAHFFAQIREEAGAKLEANEESLNYTPQALKKFKYYKNHPTEAQQDGRLDAPKVKGRKSKPLQAANQAAIANKAYAAREGNGDVKSGDGWRYRGRGFIQLTFKNGYARFNTEYVKYWKDASPNFVMYPEKVKEFPYSIRSAVWFWLENGLPKLADTGNTPEVVDKITAVINFFTDSYPSRRVHFLVSDAAFK